MKNLKPFLKVLLGVVILIVLGYFIFTAGQI